MFAPDRSLSKMLIHDTTPAADFMAKLGFKANTELLEHHDGDDGNAMADKTAPDVSAAELAKERSKAWKAKLFEGAAGARPLREGRTTAGPENVSAENAAAIGSKRDADFDDGTPRSAERPRWKPRMSPQQLAAADEARQHFSQAYAECMASPTIGATSTKLAIRPTFFNILYSHPSFGSMPDWGATGVNSKTLPLLPPVNSRAAATISPESRRAARVNWGTRSAFPSKDLPPAALPASPSKHCCPSPPLPPAPKLRSKTCNVSESTNNWIRLPPHTVHKKAIYEAMYGFSPDDPRNQKKQKELAATKLQSLHRGRTARSSGRMF